MTTYHDPFLLLEARIQALEVAVWELNGSPPEVLPESVKEAKRIASLEEEKQQVAEIKDEAEKERVKAEEPKPPPAARSSSSSPSSSSGTRSSA